MSDKLNEAIDAIVFTLSCKECDDKQNILVDKDRAIKLEKIKNEIICDKCIEKKKRIKEIMRLSIKNIECIEVN